jgi:hypothetical protein
MNCEPLPFREEMKVLYREIAAVTCRGRKRDDPLRIYLKWTNEEVMAASLVAAVTVDGEELRDLFMLLYNNLHLTVRILFLLLMRGDVAASDICGFLHRCTEVQCALCTCYRERCV